MVALDEVGLSVATVDETVVGYASCGLTAPAGVGDLDICVYPDHWGNGVGTALLERGRRHLADLGTTTIREEVLAANDAGNASCEKHFERVAERPVDFGGRRLPVSACDTSVSE